MPYTLWILPPNQSLLKFRHHLRALENWQRTPFKMSAVYKLHPLGFPAGSHGKEPACQCSRHETRVQSLSQEDPLEEGMATHSCFCLENPMDGGAWWATVLRVAKNQMRLKQLGTFTGILRKFVSISLFIFISFD